MAVRTPRLFEVIIPKTGAVADLPTPINPYFPLYAEGMFVHRQTLLGNGLVPFKKAIPEGSNLQSLGDNKNGFFDFTADPLPAHIVGEALAFFRRIYNKHSTEAEVLITKHDVTGEYRLFVPHQKVSHSGVTSIFEPTHINSDCTLVGTLHSHCNFSAFHSGTDTGDASDFDGVHVTIGMVNTAEPEIVAMIAMNKVDFHFTPPTEILDIDLKSVYQVPEWWDDYVFPHNVTIDKPASFVSITDAEWNTFKHGYQKNQQNQPKKWQQPQGSQQMGFQSPWLPKKNQNEKSSASTHAERDAYIDEYWERMGLMESMQRPWVSRESAQFNREQTERNNPNIQRSDWKKNKKQLEPLDKAIDLASDTGLLTAEDWAAFREIDLNDPGAWVSLFAEKIAVLAECIEHLSYDVSYSIKTQTPRPQLQLPPGHTQMTMDGKETPGL